MLWRSLDEQGLSLARDAAEVLLPGRRADVRWALVDGDRAIAAVAFDEERHPDLQVALRRTARGAWKQVGAGLAGDWAPLEPPLGVATRIVTVAEAVVAALVRHDDGREAELAAATGHLVVPCFDVAYGEPWAFPSVVAVRETAGAWLPATST